MTARITADLRRQKALEKAKATLILTCVEAAQIQLAQTFDGQKPARQQLQKIGRWLDAVWKLLKADGKPLSAALLKRVDDEVAAMDTLRAAIIGPCTTPQAWAAWLVTLDALLSDIHALWPEARKVGCWRYLCQTWDTWTRGFVLAADDPDVAEVLGFDLYEHIHDNTALGYASFGLAA